MWAASDLKHNPAPVGRFGAVLGKIGSGARGAGSTRQQQGRPGRLGCLVSVGLLRLSVGNRITDWD